MTNSKKLYSFKDKDPVFDVLRTLVETRASMEGVSFRKMLLMIEDETNGEIKQATLYSWFQGPTKYPRYSGVARLYLSMRAYSRKPVSIGDTTVDPVNLISVKRRA